MIIHNEATLGPLSIHFIGSSAKQEDCIYTDEPYEVKEDLMVDAVKQLFLSSFKNPIYFNFEIELGEERNPVFENITQFFDDQIDLHTLSTQLGEILHQQSTHPNVKGGDFIVCQINELIIEDEMVNCIGLFKCESKNSFLNFISSPTGYNLELSEGFALNQLDKGCLILDTDRSKGFKILTVDRSSLVEAKYWTKAFLGLKEAQDEYHYTTHYLNMTKDFVKRKAKSEDGIETKEALEIMNNSENYFKSQEVFNAKEYAAALFDDEALQEDFNEFSDKRKRAPSLGAKDFEISEFAVNKHNNVFKSVIKLDKNFSVYVHGDRTKIERGVDEFGRKYYMLYYEDEK